MIILFLVFDDDHQATSAVPRLFEPWWSRDIPPSSRYCWCPVALLNPLTSRHTDYHPPPFSNGSTGPTMPSANARAHFSLFRFCIMNMSGTFWVQWMNDHFSWTVPGWCTYTSNWNHDELIHRPLYQQSDVQPSCNVTIWRRMVFGQTLPSPTPDTKLRFVWFGIDGAVSYKHFLNEPFLLRLRRTMKYHWRARSVIGRAITSSGTVVIQSFIHQFVWYHSTGGHEFQGYDGWLLLEHFQKCASLVDVECSSSAVTSNRTHLTHDQQLFKSVSLLSNGLSWCCSSSC